MKQDPNFEIVANLAGLLEDNINSETFDATVKEIENNPALMELLMAVQFVSDAIKGNPCPDLRYTERIMQFIANAEQQCTADEKSEK